MLRKQAVAVALLALTGLAVAQQNPRAAGPPRPAGQGARAAAVGNAPLLARAVPPKRPSAQIDVPLAATGRLLVKFTDDVKARRLDDDRAVSRANGDLNAFHAILKQHNLTLRPEFTLSEDDLAAIEAKAAAFSGQAQPDLAGMMLVEAPGGLVPLAAARQINDLDFIEFVEFQQEMVVKGPTGACCLGNNVCIINTTSTECVITAQGEWQGPGTTCGGSGTCGACCQTGGVCTVPTSFDVCETLLVGTFAGTGTTCTGGECDFGACCLPNDDCSEVFQAECDALGGSFSGDGTSCGGPQCGTCCADEGSACVEDQTPEECGALPGTFLGPGFPCDADPNPCADQGDPDCGVSGTGSCFTPHSPVTPFCTLEQCCQDVCDFDPFCCDTTTDVTWPQRQAAGGKGWDAWCANHAFEICFGGPGFVPTPAPPVHNPNPPAPTPNFTAAQGYLTAAGYGPVLPPDIAPAIPHDSSALPAVGLPMPGFTGEGFDMQGLWQTGENLIATGFGTENLARGKSIKVGVIEHTAIVANALGPDQPYAHEDLSHVITETGFDNQFIITGFGDSSGHHGTATLGIIGARNQRANGTPRPQGESPSASMTDQLGCVGMAPDANLYFFSTEIIGGGGVEDAIMRALSPSGGNFGAGDVLSFSIGPASCGTLASSEGGFVALSVATAAGVTCVISAGNDCCNLDDEPQANQRDSGVVIVGACYPGGSDFLGYCRLPYSNYCRNCEESSAVHISAWGWAVATLGGGDMFFGNSPGGGALNRLYTARFNGTSAAAPQIAGLIACYQGLAKMRFGIPLAPMQIRSMFLDDDGFNQCGFLDPDDLPGTNDIPFLPCSDTFSIFSHGDWDPDSTGNRIGAVENIAFTNVLDDADDVISTPWFSGNPHVSGIEVLHGTLISGNVFSVKTIDGLVLRVRSALSLPQGPGVIQRGDLASGQVTDVMVIGTGQMPVGSMSVGVSTFANTPIGVMVVYVYNYSTNKWKAIGASMFGGFGLTQFFPVITTNPSQFVRSSDLQVKARVWTLAVNTESEYDVFHDLIQININTNPFVAVPP